MAYNWIDNLDLYLDKYGVTWQPYVQEWKTTAAAYPDTRQYTPEGLLNHHTASTDWYPKNKLTKKCNIYIDPDGVVWLMSAGYQYDSGFGDPEVLARCITDQPIEPPQDSTTAGRVLGNRWFIDIEVGHWGMGEGIPAVQRGSLIVTNAAIMDMMGWSPETRLLGHKEWTRRKVDPRWSVDGVPDTMDNIRRDTGEALMGLAPNIDECESWQIEAWQKCYDYQNDLITEWTHPGDVLTKGDYVTLEERNGAYD